MPINWDRELENFGRVPDAQIAARLGVSRQIVSRQRAAKKIPAYDEAPYHGDERPVQNMLKGVPLSRDLCRLLAQRRVELGYSQAELGKKLDCYQTDVAAYETGRHFPRPEFFDRICAALGLAYEIKIDVTVRPKPGRKRKTG